MKLILIIVICCTLSSAEMVIDYSKVIPREDVPGFWNNRIIQPLNSDFHHKFDRNGRIVGGNEVERNAHPYQLGIFLAVHWWTAFCGGCLISPNVAITAAHCT